jgi:hypothetical protein
MVQKIRREEQSAENTGNAEKKEKIYFFYQDEFDETGGCWRDFVQHSENRV